jgi:lipopolysaccharide/colanic/teichoic acid biosynthesis glycosyltransferase
MYLIIKRAFDIVASLIALLILLPLFIPIIILLRLTGEGEVFYKQDRVGFKNTIFKIWKFATMLKNSPNMGAGDVTLRRDPRVTPMGRFLRMTKINELPQIVNILIGDMSVVGPRPLMIAGFNRYEKKFRNEVYNVRPGLTGIGSIVFRDEEKILTESGLPPHECYEKIILPYKGALEIWYQGRMSFYTDFMIIFLTAWVIVSPDSNLPYRIFKDLPKRISANIPVQPQKQIEPKLS